MLSRIFETRFYSLGSALQSLAWTRSLHAVTNRSLPRVYLCPEVPSPNPMFPDLVMIRRHTDVIITDDAVVCWLHCDPSVCKNIILRRCVDML